MQAYALCTWNVERYRSSGVKAPECWAFLVIGSKAELTPLVDRLDLPLREWMVRGLYAMGLDLHVEMAHDFPTEVRAKEWELKQLGMSWEWSADLIPGAPKDSTTTTGQNTFDTEEQFHQALIEPFDPKSQWPIDSDETTTDPSILKPYVSQPRNLAVPSSDWRRPYVPPTIPAMH